MCDDCLTPERAAEIQRAVTTTYRAVAEQPEGHFAYPVGRASAIKLGYDAAWLNAVPAAIVGRFVGVGNPFAIRRPARGERVLDLGCGCGLDVFVAALLAGPEGRAVGVDVTPEMMDLARRFAGQWPPKNVEFHAGSIEQMPFADGAFDMAVSNGVLNLVPDKDRAFREIHRVLRPGGAFVAADLLVTESVPPEVLANMDAWST